MIEDSSKSAPRRSFLRGFALLAAILAVAAGLAILLYGMKAPSGKETAEASSCPAARERVAQLKPLVHGEVAALSLASSPAPLPDLSFDGADGTRKHLADFKGREVLLNLWATWCVPCRQEMPALDQLEAKLGSKDFEVVAVNIDTAKLDRPKAFLNEAGVKSLAFYADNTATIFQNLRTAGKALGLPTTILIGKDGCEIGTMAGPANWDSADALALLTAGQS